MLGKHQKGLSPIGILFVVCVLAFALMVTLKLAQHYIDFYSVRSIFQEKASSGQARDMAPEKIKEDLYKQLAINNIRDFSLDERAYFVSESGARVLGFNYEVREHLFANIDAVLTFKFEEPIE